MEHAPSQRAKTSEEVEAIEIVQRATEKAFDEVVVYLRSSSTPNSKDAHRIVDEVLLRAGCESPEGHILAGGVQSAEPHEFGTGPYKPGQPIVIDIYPRSKTTGYFADMSRTVCLGTPPAELQEMYDAVLGAQELGISMVRPGVACRDIQKAVETFFIERGFTTSGTGTEFLYAEGFVHGVGHGVGQNVHEAPSINRKSTEVLEEGDVVTIEPGLYYKHIGGVRLEDMVLVTGDGCRNLTHAEKSLVL